MCHHHGADFRDPDGNKLCVIRHDAAPGDSGGTNSTSRPQANPAPPGTARR